VIREIPESDWLLVAKLDIEEAHVLLLRRQAQPVNVGMAGAELRFDGRNLLAATQFPPPEL
jgi:hypothetical protein